jgi:hypothetical protein
MGPPIRLFGEGGGSLMEQGLPRGRCEENLEASPGIEPRYTDLQCVTPAMNSIG